MENVKTTPAVQHYFTIALCILLACLALFSLDHETHSVFDLFKPGNLVALVIYFTPTFIVSLFFYHLLSKKYNSQRSLVLSLVAGIPISFALLISLLFALRN
jgi:RsiW-degrading membrane proteinase PrsW (M82 family)